MTKENHIVNMQSTPIETNDPIRDLIGRGREMAIGALAGLPALQRQAIEALDAVAACKDLIDRAAATVGQRVGESASQLEAIGEAAGRRTHGTPREVEDAEGKAKREAGEAVAMKCLGGYKPSGQKAGEGAFAKCTAFDGGIVRAELDWSNPGSDLAGDLVTILKRDQEIEATKARGVEAFSERYHALANLGCGFRRIVIAQIGPS